MLLCVITGMIIWEELAELSLIMPLYVTCHVHVKLAKLPAAVCSQQPKFTAMSDVVSAL